MWCTREKSPKCGYHRTIKLEVIENSSSPYVVTVAIDCWSKKTVLLLQCYCVKVKDYQFFFVNKFKCCI